MIKNPSSFPNTTNPQAELLEGGNKKKNVPIMKRTFVLY